MFLAEHGTEGNLMARGATYQLRYISTKARPPRRMATAVMREPKGEGA